MAQSRDAVEAGVSRIKVEGGNVDDDIFLNSMILPKPTDVYRRTSLGKTLINAVEDIREKHKISNKLCEKIMEQFDRRILTALEQRPSARVTFKAEKLTLFRNLDEDWEFKFKDVEFSHYNFLASVPSLTVFAVVGQAPPSHTRGNLKKKMRTSVPGLEEMIQP